MRANIFPFVLAIIAFGGAAISSPTVPVPRVAAQIDLAGLHEQAASALQMLQISQERRLALEPINEAAF